jgi:hypothetical protein
VCVCVQVSITASLLRWNTYSDGKLMKVMAFSRPSPTLLIGDFKKKSGRLTTIVTFRNVREINCYSPSAFACVHVVFL